MPFSVKLVRRVEVAAGTMAFWFEKPPGFEYRAGQYGEWMLIDPPETDAEGNGRAFTFASAPYEAEIGFATRMRDTAFKRVLKTVPLGTTIELDGPFGNFILHQNMSRPAVFLMGGIGITPARSMILQAVRDRAPHCIFLFYSNKRPEDAAFLDELMVVSNPNYLFIGTMTEMEKSARDWQGERGFITADMVKKYVSDVHGQIYYTAGPPAMVAAMRKLLTDAGVSEDDIKTEEFSGY